MVCAEGQLSLRCFLTFAIGLLLFNFYLIAVTNLTVIFIWNLAYLPIAIILLYSFLDSHKFEVAIRATFLGFVFAGGCIVAYYGSISLKPFGCYCFIIATFHYSEYYAVAMSNPKSLSTDSFILNHSVQYAIAAVSSWLEFFIEVYYWPVMKEHSIITIVGIIICIISEIIRKLAILTASSNFNHVVQFNKANDHKLITHGIYRFMRHPSYVGWFWWSIGTQIVLINPICIVIYTIASWTFFSHRVMFEEITLLNFFGRQYIEYQKNTPTGLPFIKGYLLE